MAQAEKKVEIEVNGKKIRVMPHMLKDFAKFGGTETRRKLKEPPRELSVIPLPKKLILPRTEAKLPEILAKPIDEGPIKPLEKVDVIPEIKVDIKSDLTEKPTADYPGDEVKEIIPEVKIEKKVKKPVKKIKK